MTQKKRILVAIATYKRTMLLDKLLASLNSIVFSRAPEAHVEIAVIDNDPDQSANNIVERHQTRFQYPLHYHTELRPGVTFVRNQALDLAKGFDLLAFIDDDEMATPHWLDALLIRYLETGGAAIFGPVHPIYEDGSIGWIEKWGIHGRYMDSDTERQKPGATCNCLIDMHVIREEGLEFDPRMSLTGAEDTLFFSHLMDKGYRLFNAHEALVHEHIPADRATPDWLLKRWYRTGITDALISGRHAQIGMTRLKSLFGGIARVGVGSALALVTFLGTLGLHKTFVMQRLYTVSRGLGMMAFAFGKQYEEYGRK